MWYLSFSNAVSHWSRFARQFSSWFRHTCLTSRAVWRHEYKLLRFLSAHITISNHFSWILMWRRSRNCNVMFRLEIKYSLIILQIVISSHRFICLFNRHYISPNISASVIVVEWYLLIVYITCSRGFYCMHTINTFVTGITRFTLHNMNMLFDCYCKMFAFHITSNDIESYTANIRQCT